ncbi:MAG: peptidyl-prolyl cis-trans isomerase [Oscillospiraceae bacterium]|nr:peptidyl-prolyl cis-trans isomerase [Oscillospiraceae bacterium]
MTKKQHPNGRALILCFAVLVLTMLAVGLWFLRSPFPRLEVGGFRITEEEYLRAMYQARSDVLSDHAAVSHSLTDWSAETPLGDPRRLTMERALEILTEAYAVDTLAVERGYLSAAGYEAMKRDMELINEKRQEALDSGAVITGFPSFTMDDYISYRSSSLRLQFCTDPDNPEYPVTPEELRQRYEADRDSLYRQPDSMELAFLVIDGADGELEQALEALREKTLETADLAAALEAFPGLKPYYQEISVDPGNYGVYARSHSDVLVWANELQPGEISRIFRQDDRLCLIQCLARTEHEYAPLEEVQSIVEQSIRESRYDALIAERMEQMEVHGDLEKLYRFTAEKLP